MADDLTNFDQHTAWFRNLVDSFNFKLPGKDESVGKDMANLAAQRMTDRSEQQQGGPDGNIWLANEPKYAAWKRKKYDVHAVGVLTGQMLSHESMLGAVTVDAEEVTMRYGTGEPATRFRGGETYDVENPPTDRQKAEWFEDGGRKFYGLDERISDELAKTAGEALDEYLAERDGGYRVL